MGSDVGYNIGFKLLQDCSNVTFYKYPGNFNGDSPSISPFVYSIRSRQERVPVVSSASTLTCPTAQMFIWVLWLLCERLVHDDYLF